MHRSLLVGLAATLTLVACGASLDRTGAGAASAETVTSPAIEATPMNPSLAFTSIAGEPLPLSQFAGKAVLVVNTASRCGYTSQYAGLQSLWSQYRDRGLVVVGVPSNDFGGQEPGTEAQVKTFCEINYGVDFPLTAKTVVIGADRHPFFAWAEERLGEPARPRWNFHKILIDRTGTPVAAFPSSVKPEDASLVMAIESAL